MLRLSFITPAALALLALLPALWAFALLTPRRLAPARFWASLVIRGAILLALVLALAGTQLVRPVQAVTTVFLIDLSDSVPQPQREQAAQYVADALRAMPQGDQAAIVAFGENALVERVPSSLTTLSRLTSTPLTTRTNIQDAIQLGLALLPADTQKRLVLLSDGGENSGHAADAARLARVRGVPIDVVATTGSGGPDVVVSELKAPAMAREGQDETLGVVVRSSLDTTGKLQVFVDGKLAAEQQVTLTAGMNEIPVRIAAGDAGFRRLEVRLDAEGDTEPKNNRAAAFTDVQGPPRILLIASAPERAETLRSALAAVGARAEVAAPGGVPADLAALNAYAAIMLVDTPARDLPRPLMDALPTYVKQLGRGLAMVGGVDSFGAGGYRRTPLEEVLPVDLDPRTTAQQPDLGLVMVIDRSGSMGMSGSGGGRTKLDLAKEAVYQASLGLSQNDQIGLVVFDFSAQWVLPLQKLPSAVEIERALSSFDANGGTDIRPGIEQAARALAPADARIKHVILLTDGIAESNYGDLIDQMRAGGITISTVAIGTDANPNLEEIARRGGGRFYQVRQISDVPRIFLQETVLAAGRDIIEEPFTPTIALPSPIVRGLNALPSLFGLNGTEIKPTARAILVSPDNRPVLAQWQYGLGRVVAWTSDLQPKWAKAWVAWGEFPRFVGGLVDLLLPPRTGDRLTVQATNEGAQSALEVTALDAQGRPLNDLDVAGQLLDPENSAAALRFVQVGPGRYRATATTTTPGVYLAQVAAADRQGQPIGSATSGLVVSYSPEYGEQRANPALLRDLAAITGGRVEPSPEAVFASSTQPVGAVQEIALPLLWLALLLWPLDVAVRRLSLRRSDLNFIGVRRARARHAAASAQPALARLSAAKQRARPTPSASFRPAEQAPASPAPEAATTTTQATPPNSPPAPASPPTEVDALARLMAAKRRARGRRQSD
jgi:Mg-chelatase subunit ChlD